MSKSTTSRRHVDLITSLSTTVNESTFLLATPLETRRNERFTEGEWQARMESFLKEPLNGIPNDPVARQLTMALLTKSYANHLDKALVTRLTKPLANPAKLLESSAAAPPTPARRRTTKPAPAPQGKK